MPPGDDLRRGVRRGPAVHLELLVVRGYGAQAKVNHLDVVPFVQQDVLELDIPVDDLGVVAVVHPAQDLLEQEARLPLPEPALALDVIKQGTIVRVLHHDKDLALSLYGFEHVDDVAVVQALQNSDLPVHPLPVLRAVQPELVNDLDSDLLLGQLLDPKPDLAEPALADDMAEVVPRQGLTLLVQQPRLVCPGPFLLVRWHRSACPPALRPLLPPSRDLDHSGAHRAGPVRLAVLSGIVRRGGATSGARALLLLVLVAVPGVVAAPSTPRTAAAG